MQALAGYTGWKFEYVKCDWSNCFDKLENGEIDIMGDISYTDERAQKMLFSDEPMSEEKYILYADLSEADLKVIGAYYGIYSPDVDTLLLAEVYSGPLFLPITNLFTIRLCAKTNSEEIEFVSTRMIFK